MSEFEEILQFYEELCEAYTAIKRYVRLQDPYLLEQWKAGGFLVDDTILSMYPNLDEVMEKLEAQMVECSICRERVPEKTAHNHQGEWIGDDCCWDERLRSSE